MQLKVSDSVLFFVAVKRSTID